MFVAVVLPLASSLLGLYDRIEHWGKFVHAVDGLCATLLFGVLLLAWRGVEKVDLADELAGLMAAAVAAVWFSGRPLPGLGIP